MFDHRVRTPSHASRNGIIAGLCLLTLAGAFGIQRYRQSRVEALSVQSPLNVSMPAPLAAPLNRSGIGVQAAAPASVPRDVAIKKLAILVFKSEKRVEVWGNRAEQWSLLREYPVLAASGAAGPKLIEGDRQVPEGVYRIVEMNPRSRFHMSCKLDYPNAFDKKMAERDGRLKLGGDICIHGKSCSIGCVAIGDPAIEDLFSQIARVGPLNVKVIIAPNDLREHLAVKNPYLKVSWTKELYESIGQELKPFPKPR